MLETVVYRKLKVDFHSVENVARSTFSARFLNYACVLMHIEKDLNIARSQKKVHQLSTFSARKIKIKDGCRGEERTRF